MISIIVAMTPERVIGGNNSLLWHISEDLKRFKAITTGHPVVMGRKTFQSMGRPLPGRRNIVVTRDENFSHEGVEVVHSLDQIKRSFPSEEEVFVIGGGEIYRQALPMTSKLYLTIVQHDYEGDTFFPETDPSQWRETFREDHERGKDYPHPFRYVNLERIPQSV